MLPPETTSDNKKPTVAIKLSGFEGLRDCLKLSNGARDRNRTGTPVIHEAADFKSDVSTYFTTRAQQTYFQTKKPRLHQLTRLSIEITGGAIQSRTGLTGFAIRGITALLSRQNHLPTEVNLTPINEQKREAFSFPLLWNLEREKSLELSTSTLARLRSTN